MTIKRNTLNELVSLYGVFDIEQCELFHLPLKIIQTTLKAF